MSSTSFLQASPNALQMVRGTSKTIELTVSDENGDAFDLTSAVVWFTVKKRITDETVLIQKRSTIVSEVAITDARAGQAEIYLVPGDTFKLDTREYVFDIWVIIPGDEDLGLLEARYLVVGPSAFELQASVTRIQ